MSDDRDRWGIEDMATIQGTAGADTLEAGNDPFNLIFGQDGDDIILGGRGRDHVNGGNGSDTFITDLAYAGGGNLTYANEQYLLGGPEGDIAVGVERIIFFRDTVVLLDPSKGLESAIALPFSELAAIEYALGAVLRLEAPDFFAEQIALLIRSGNETFQGYVDALVASGATSTVPALLMQAAIFGTIPTSDKLNSLTAFASAQYDYYKNTLQSGSAQLGPYEALGRGFASTTEFKTAFSGGTDPDFVDSAYSTLFHRDPTSGQHAALLAQVDYFEALYRKAGLPESQAGLEARGAVYGQMVGYAAQDTQLGYGAEAVSILYKLAGGDTSVYGEVFGS
jgi:hypothetical protein